MKISQEGTTNSAPDPVRLAQSDKLYDYIKFHLTMYLATPTALGIIGSALQIDKDSHFRVGLLGMIGANVIAGVSASWFLADHLFARWADMSRWYTLGEKGDDLLRKCLHHYLYWIGLGWAIVWMCLATKNP
jgi:hypothetical protein